MALLFVGGVMNPVWVAALAALVTIEKLAPKEEAVAQVLGGIMIGMGIVRLVWDWPS
jgi:predicted metal-binding membrane protein